MYCQRVYCCTPNICHGACPTTPDYTPHVVADETSTRVGRLHSVLTYPLVGQPFLNYYSRRTFD